MNANDITQNMMQHDYFSQWLGITVLKVEAGYCMLEMKVRRDMLNGFGIAHGGITYSLADSALAFASNSKGIQSVSIETSVSHVVGLKELDEIVAEAVCEAESNKLGHYKVNITLKGEPVKTIALFRGIVYKTSKTW